MPAWGSPLNSNVPARMRFRRCEMDVFGMNKLLVRLQFMLQSLPRAEKAVAEYMAAHVAQMSDMTLSMLSDETSVSEATILRFCRRLGYSSYIQLRQAFAFAANEDHPDSPEPISVADAMPAITAKLIQSVNRSLEDMNAFISGDYDRVLAAILGARSIYLFASGDAVTSCQYACTKFNRIGLPAFVVRGCVLSVRNGHAF